jgi:hypothetical protein
MDLSLSMAMSVLMRWLHIVSVITILGGFVYARFAVAPAIAALSAADGTSFSNRAIASLRPVLYAAILGVLVSGLYNYLTKPTYPPHYHMVIGIKFLFVLHVFSTAVLYTIPNANEGNRIRRLNGLVISGGVIVLISALLRYLTLNAQ